MHPLILFDETAAPDLIVTGKIDRVDRHPSGKRRAIDYKVVNSSDLSKKRRRRQSLPGEEGSNWIDLQLPVYRTRLAWLWKRVNVEVGYISACPISLKRQDRCRRGDG